MRSWLSRMRPIMSCPDAEGLASGDPAEKLTHGSAKKRHARDPSRTSSMSSKLIQLASIETTKYVREGRIDPAVASTNNLGYA